MFTLLRDDRFSRAINSFKQKEQRITRWLDGSAQQNEPLFELFTHESADFNTGYIQKMSMALAIAIQHGIMVLVKSI